MKSILLLIMIDSLTLFASEEIHNFQYENSCNKALLKPEKFLQDLTDVKISYEQNSQL